jgi:hypothetical protein
MSGQTTSERVQDREQELRMTIDLSPRMFQPFDQADFDRFRSDPKRQALVKRILSDDES